MINCISEHTHYIFEKREHALLGISPFNGYFTESRIKDLLYWSMREFAKINIFIPDELPIYNFIGAGCSERKAIYKVKRQANYLRNKIFKAFSSLGHSREFAQTTLIDMSYLEKNSTYVKIRDLCYELHSNSSEFREQCLIARGWIAGGTPLLENENNPNPTSDYILREMPVFMDTPNILNVPSSVFVYHKLPDFILELFNNNLGLCTNLNQGFIQVNLEDLS